ncbi:MAG: paraquat-inducible protein A [Verrucomicrobiales bacterium]
MCEHKPNPIQRAAAFSLAALALFFVAHFFPFLSMEVGTQSNEIALFRSAGALYDYGNPWLAFIVAVFIVAAPAALIGGSLYVLLPLLWGRALPGARGVCRWIYDAGPWNMIEVFMLGILVSLLKLTQIASVQLGISFWAFALLIVCLTASFAAIDRIELWRRLETAVGGAH